MITIQLDKTDLESLRFAYSPLIETVMSYRLLHKPNAPAAFLPWIEEARRALHGVDLPFMSAATLSRGYIADFLTPTPIGTRMTIDEELVRLRQMPPEYVYKNMQTVIEASEETEVRRYFLAYPHDALQCLAQEIELYWERVMARHWPHIQSVLDNDVLYRAREMALYGVENMFTSLNPIVQYTAGQLLLDKTYLGKECEIDYGLNGRGLQLVPGVFSVCGLSWQVEPEWLPMIIYGARGAGLWYTPDLPDPEAALTLALGEGKARLLQALKTPAHTSELAHRLSITAGAVSQQLGRLNQAGLVESHRSSSKVYYRLTPRGEKLLTLFTE